MKNKIIVNCPECDGDGWYVDLRQNEQLSTQCQLCNMTGKLTGEEMHKWLTDQLGLGWVSVDDRLPEVENYWSKTYLIAYKVFGNDYKGLIASGRYYTRDEKGENTGWVFSGCGKVSRFGYEVIAYKPLPAPPEVSE